MMMESYYALLYKSPLKQAFTDSRRRICCSSTGGSCTLRLGQIKADIKNRLMNLVLASYVVGQILFPQELIDFAEICIKGLLSNC
ncbi:uncharacterized protein LOC141672221 isoform X2 [Apium graveolens]|uniref:uncharacterized protein LOC141672221 isoform X2 n=1 Tax=Apium graveolens TaxID=4045 RepID=UPI003D79E5FD